MRLGCAIRILGRRGIRAYDARRVEHAPHLGVSLAYLRDVFGYLEATNIHMYRMAAEIAPALATPGDPQFQLQLEECAPDLNELGLIIRHHDVRISFHAPSWVQLATPDTAIAQRSIWALRLLAALLDALQADADAVIVVHTGGLYGAVDAALARWVAHWTQLPASVQRRLVLEHEHVGASLGVVLRLHAATGVPVVFDHLHWCLNNPERWPVAEALGRALATWSHERTPKVHMSSPRTELQAVERVATGSQRQRWGLRPPRPGHHADFINTWEFAGLMRSAAGLRDFDIMLEAKASDVALLRLQHDLLRYVPDVAAWLGYSTLPDAALVREQRICYASEMVWRKRHRGTGWQLPGGAYG